MKSYRNILVLISAIAFSTLGFFGEPTGAQTRAAIVKTPTPKAKKSSSPVAKTTPKPTAKPSPKPSPKSASTAKTPKPAAKSDSKTSAKIAPAKNAKTAAKPTTDSKKSQTKTTDSKTAKTNSKTETPNQKPTPAPTASPQIIVAATTVKVRRNPTASSPQLTIVQLGKTLPVLEKNAAWYRVQYASGQSGWISKTLVKDFDSSKRDALYREIAEKYPAAKASDFATASELADFMKLARTAARTDEQQADFSFRRLLALSAAVKAVPFGKSEQSPYKSFLKANEKDVVYSEPAGAWYVRSDLFWELHGKYTQLPIAEEIAWTAAQNPIPGECEGYVNCYLYLIRATSGEYLNFYPNGKYSKRALDNVTNLLDPIVADLAEKKVYTAPSDISDRAEFNRFLTELRTIISKMPSIEKNKALQQINQLGEGYK